MSDDEFISAIKALSRQEQMSIELVMLATTTGRKAIGHRTDLDRSERSQEAWNVVMRDVNRKEAAGSQTA